MNKKGRNNKGIKGITLVALVVTIIVLLILAGITVNLSIGNKGLFNRTEGASNIWKKAEENESLEMQKFTNTYEETLNNLELGENTENTEGDNEEEIVENQLAKITGNEKTKTDTTDKKGNRIVVPAGFKVINPEATVNEGIVIEDVSAKDSYSVGNQFVWIPCEIETEENKNDGKLKYDRYAFTREDWNSKQKKLNEKDADGSYKIQLPSTLTYYHEAMPAEEKQSIETNGGYYFRQI